MKFAIRDHRGMFGTTWDGQNLAFNRPIIGEGETFEILTKDADGNWTPLETPQPPPAPPTPDVPTYPLYTPEYIGREREWFSVLVFGKPFGQQTLLDLEPTLNANGWMLTSPNAAGERTKVHPTPGPWVRVGFGEGVWVWIPQP